MSSHTAAPLRDLPLAPPMVLLADVITRATGPEHLPTITALHDRVFGPGSQARTAYRIREGAPPLSPFCRHAATADGVIIAALRMTDIVIGGRPGALLLGPLAVDPDWSGRGYGKRLVAEVLAAARSGGRDLVLLVGNRSYYERFGFVPVPPGQIALPGPVDYARLLAAELTLGAIGLFAGAVGRLEQVQP